MLPVVICEADSAVRTRWMDVLDDLSRREYPSLKLEMLPGTKRDLNRTLEVESGIMLVILAVSSAEEGGVDGCIQLFLDVMDRNRDSYVLLYVYDGDHLNTVLSCCMRPAGILLSPIQEVFMRATLKRILNDYASFQRQESGEEYIMVTSGKTVQRISFRDILYLEAQDKMLNIRTSRHVVTVRKSLHAIEKALPASFVRCHRSYIVNATCVERFDLPNMTIELTTQERLPISRSCKDQLKARFQIGDKA